VEIADTSTITATVRDQDGNTIPEKTVDFTLTANNSGAVLNPAVGTTNTAGQISVTYTAGNIRSVTDTITATSEEKSGTVDVIINEPVASSITVSASPTTVEETGTSTVTATVRDQDGNLMSGQTVNFTLASNNSGGGLNPDGGTTNADGQISVIYTAGSTDGVSDTVRASVGSFSDNVIITVSDSGSPAFLFTGGADEMGFFEIVDYVGAFNPDAATTWADGWTIPHGSTSADAGIWDDSNIVTTPFGQATVGGLTVTDNGDGSITIAAGTMTQDATLTNDRVWKLDGTVFVGNDSPAAGQAVTLTIEPGTKIVGLTPGKRVSRLVVSRGNRIMAEGTKNAPILMTSEQEGSGNGVGEWGGLAINGFAPTNIGTDVDGEAETGLYGGCDPADNSGVLKYVVVAHAGWEFGPEVELNGIAFQGVGSGTVVDHIQVHQNADDGVAFFGGNCYARHVYLTENEDDSLAWTFGWTGKVQFVSIHKSPAKGGNGIEGDNLEEDNDASPRSYPMLANMTIVGYADNLRGLHLSSGTGVNIYNTIITGWGSGQIDIDDLSTFENAVTDAGWPNLSGRFTMENSLAFGAFVDMENAEEPWGATDWYTNQNNFIRHDPNLNDDGTFSNASPAFLFTGGADEMGFFEIVDYRNTWQIT